MFSKDKKFLVIVKQQFYAKLCVFFKHMKLSIFVKHMKFFVVVKWEHYSNFVSCHLVTLEFVSYCYNLSLLHFKL